TVRSRRKTALRRVQRAKLCAKPPCDAPLPALRAAGRRSEPQPGSFLCCGGRQQAYNDWRTRRKNKITDVLTAQRFSGTERSRYCHRAWVWHAPGSVRKRVTSFSLVVVLTLAHAATATAEQLDQQ